ncbi:MAG: hypothetical protein NVSMB17_17210 [Candidatus Dormibacteria bacterium]
MGDGAGRGVKVAVALTNSRPQLVSTRRWVGRSETRTRPAATGTEPPVQTVTTDPGDGSIKDVLACPLTVVSRTSVPPARTVTVVPSGTAPPPLPVKVTAASRAPTPVPGGWLSWSVMAAGVTPCPWEAPDNNRS